MAHRSVPAPFLTKTFHLVDDPETDDVISWNDDGTTFVVWKTAEFAKDLLPNYFKHNNFSSFVRQLNTYGFRKTVPDKWEFANKNFQRGQKELLPQIRRRKKQNLVAANQTSSPATSGEEHGSTSTSSPDSKNPSSLETVQFADLSGENQKLRKDNEMLSSELAQTKKQCDELVAFLTRCLKVAPEQIWRIMNPAECEGGKAKSCDDDENESCMKLFGVVVKKKREFSETDGGDFSGGRHKKELKTSMGDEIDKVPWMKGETSGLCN